MPDIKNMGPSFVGDLLRGGAPDYTVGAQVVNSATITQISDSTNTANGRVTGTATVTGTTLSNVQIPTTAKIIKSTVQCPCPAPTGTRTTGYVFTIVNGAITAAVGY